MATCCRYIPVVHGLLLIIVNGRYGFAQNTTHVDLMVCRPLTEVLGSFGERKVDRALLPFFRGPAGPPGPHGKTGGIGSPVEPEDDKIWAIVHDQTRKIFADLFEMEMKLYRIAGRKTLTYGKKEKECMDKFKAPINVGSMCYALVGGEGLSWTYKDAEAHCMELGGYPADLNSYEVYEKLYDYIDYSFSTMMRAWTGMRYEGDKLVLANGTEAKFWKWMYPFPQKSTTATFKYYYRTFIGVAIIFDTSSMFRALENCNPERRFSYAVCHFSLDGPAPSTSGPVTTPSHLDIINAIGTEDEYYDYVSGTNGRYPTG